MWKCIICMLPPHINFLKYYEKSFTVGSVLMWRIETTFQNVEFYYFLYSRDRLVFIKIMKNPAPLVASVWAEFRPLFIMSRFIIFMQPPYIDFLKYYEKCFAVGIVMMRRIQSTFQNVEDYYFMQTPLTNLLKYNDKTFSVGRLMVRRNHFTFQNVEGFYFYAADIQ